MLKGVPSRGFSAAYVCVCSGTHSYATAVHHVHSNGTNENSHCFIYCHQKFKAENCQMFLASARWGVSDINNAFPYFSDGLCFHKFQRLQTSSKRRWWLSPCTNQVSLLFFVRQEDHKLILGPLHIVSFINISGTDKWNCHVRPYLPLIVCFGKLLHAAVMYRPSVWELNDNLLKWMKTKWQSVNLWWRSPSVCSFAKTAWCFIRW